MLDESIRSLYVAAMKQNRLLLQSGGAVLLLLALTACQNPPPLAATRARPDARAAATWTARRTAQLETMGLKHGAASLKAQEEWAHRSFDGTGAEAYMLYDSAAAAGAKQQQFEQELTQLAKNS